MRLASVTQALATVPVGLRVDGRAVLVVGAGPIAARKAAVYVDQGAVVTVVAPEHSHSMDALAVAVRHYRRFEATDLDGVWLVVTATGDPSVDGAVYDEAESRRIWCNAADDPEHCSVILPAVSRKGPLTVAIGTGGQSPAVASWLRRRIDALLDANTLGVFEAAASARRTLRDRGLPTEVPDWAEVLDGPAVNLVAAGKADELEALLVDRVTRRAAAPSAGPSDRESEGAENGTDTLPMGGLR